MIDYELKPLKAADMTPIMHWRNAQIDILRQKKPLTLSDQARYFNNVIIPAQNQKFPDLILYGFYCRGVLIGYGGIVHIDWEAKRGEVSFITNPQRRDRYKPDFSTFLRMIIHIAFHSYNLHKLTAENWNRPVHTSILEDNGFRREGTLVDHVVINGNYVDAVLHGLVNSNS